MMNITPFTRKTFFFFSVLTLFLMAYTSLAETSTHTVDASQGWQSTGIFMNDTRDYFTVNYLSGQWRSNPNDAYHDASGGNSFVCTVDCAEPVPGQPKGGLIGRVGDNGTPFFIGNSFSKYARNLGELQLRMNDPDTSDNDGILTIEVVHEPYNDNGITVDSTQGWQSTGIFMNDTRDYFTVNYLSGQWRSNPNDAYHDASGGNSFVCTVDCAEPVPGQPKGGLIGRVGDNGTPFFIGNSLSKYARNLGELQLRMNDPDTSDNDGMITVEVILEPFEDDTYSVMVNANEGWQDFGITLDAGDAVTIIHTAGLWRNNPTDTLHGPDGGDSHVCRGDGCVEPLPDYPKGGLIGRIGGGTSFFIGNRRTLIVDAQSTGNLELRMNDVGLTDNEGTVTMQIQVSPTGGQYDFAFVYPIHGQILDSANDYRPRFQWTPASSAEWYHVLITSPDGGLVFNNWYQAAQICQPTLCETPTDLWLPTTGQYTWWLGYWSQSVGSNYADTYQSINFSVVLPPPPPITPVISTDNTITWLDNAGVLWYRIWMGTSDYSNTLIFEWYPASELCSDGMCTAPLPATPLQPGTYEWWLETWGPGGRLTWTETGGTSVTVE